jgi:hypothetical protein
MTRTAGPNKRKAVELLEEALGEVPRDMRTATAMAACAYALLEVAYQVGRVADHVPMWGPPEER